MAKEYEHRQDGPEALDVALGVPVDWVRWGPILSGTFAALTLLAILSTFGAAVAASAYDQGDDARPYSVAASVWGVVSMLLAFGFGGWIASHFAAVRGRESSMLNGFMVAGVGIPILIFMLGNTGAMMGQAAMIDDRSPAGQAAAQDAAEGETASTAVGNEAAGAAWATFIALILAVVAATAGGYLGSRDWGMPGRRPGEHRAGGPVPSPG